MKDKIIASLIAGILTFIVGGLLYLLIKDLPFYLVISATISATVAVFIVLNLEKYIK